MAAAKRLSKNRISRLPSSIIETILCLVPIRDAVRTSILSRNWRHKWVRIPKLLFNVDDMFNKSNDEHQLAQRYKREPMTKKYKVFYAIFQVLLLHQGPILEFTLSMEADFSCYEIDQIILHLSVKNTLKKLTLDLRVSKYNIYHLPPSFFSLQQLTDLSLRKCMLDLTPTFRRLRSFTSLSLIDVEICTETFLHFISTSPLLKRLSMRNLFDGMAGEILDVDPFELFKSSPNLEKLKLEQEFKYHGVLLMDPEINSLDDYSDIWLENLHELEIESFFNLKLELEFVKLILAKSPMLKRVRIRLSEVVQKDEELKILRTILLYRRASPYAEILVERS